MASAASQLLTIAGIVIAAIVLLALILYGIRRWRSSNDPSRDESGTETITNEDFSRGTVSLRTKLRSWQTAGQVMAAIAIVLLLLMGWIGYTMFKTGSPNEFVTARWFQMGLVAMIMAPVGARWAFNKPDLSYVKLIIEREDVDEEPLTKRVWFDSDNIDADAESQVIYEYIYKGPFGITSRPKRVAEEPELRGETKLYAADEEKVGWELPTNALQDTDGNYTLRCSGYEVVASPHRRANLEPRPPRRKSPREFRKAWRERQKLQNKIEEMGAQIARYADRVDLLEETIDQDREQAREELAEMLELLNQINGNITHVDQHLDRMNGRSSRDSIDPDRLEEFGVDGDTIDELAQS